MGLPGDQSDRDRQSAPGIRVPRDQPDDEAPRQPGGQQGEGYEGQRYQGQGGQGHQGQAYPDYPSYQGHPGYQGSQVGGYQPGAPVGAPAGRVNSLSIAALVCGLAQFVLWFLLLVPGFIAALLGLIFGVMALGQIRQRGEAGRGMALTGVILGTIGVLGGIALGILIAVGSASYHAHMGY